MTTNFVFSPTGRTVRPPTAADFDFDITAIEQATLVAPGSQVPMLVDDANVLRSTDAITENHFNVQTSHLVGEDRYFDAISLEATNGQVIGTEVFRVADGACRILAKSPLRGKSVDVTFARVGGQVADELVSWVAGSLSAHVESAMAARYTGKTIANALVYSKQDHANGVYVRNPACWLYGIDLTCASPWNSGAGNFWGGTAITPRHMVIATHAMQGPGNVLRFVTNDNQVITRTIDSVYTLSEPLYSFWYDCTICKLDSDLPASIKPAKLMPANFPDYVPSIEKFGLTITAFDSEERALPKHLFKVMLTADSAHYRIAMENCDEPGAVEMTQDVIGGDSGNPVFMVVNGELVLLTCLTFGGGGGGTAYHSFLDLINTGLTALGGGYQVQTVDLSGFTSYA